MTQKNDAAQEQERAAEEAAQGGAAKPASDEGKAAAAPSEADLAMLVEALKGPRRRARQDASHELAIIAKESPSALADVIPDLIDALYRPEAQTRWEALNALAELAHEYGNDVAEAFDGAEASLFDEGSATVRLAAFHFLASFGATSHMRSDQAWPLLDEAIQCYHGDSEYRDMLTYLLEFANGSISAAAASALVSRISFDAESGRGYIKDCSADIIKAAQANAPAEPKGTKRSGKRSDKKAKEA
jgi:hypothetical protein